MRLRVAPRATVMGQTAQGADIRRAAEYLLADRVAR